MKHEVRVTGGPLYGWRAVCSCGYQGYLFTVKVHADRDGDEHQLQMARAGEGVND